jgi:hypothetical protein
MLTRAVESKRNATRGSQVIYGNLAASNSLAEENHQGRNNQLKRIQGGECHPFPDWDPSGNRKEPRYLHFLGRITRVSQNCSKDWIMATNSERSRGFRR